MHHHHLYPEVATKKEKKNPQLSLLTTYTCGTHSILMRSLGWLFVGSLLFLFLGGDLGESSTSIVTLTNLSKSGVLLEECLQIIKVVANFACFRACFASVAASSCYHIVKLFAS